MHARWLMTRVAEYWSTARQAFKHRPPLEQYRHIRRDLFDHFKQQQQEQQQQWLWLIAALCWLSRPDCYRSIPESLLTSHLPIAITLQHHHQQR